MDAKVTSNWEEIQKQGSKKLYSVNLIFYPALFLHLTLSTDSFSLIPDACYMILNYIYPSYNQIEVPCLIESNGPVANTQHKLLGILMAFLRKVKIKRVCSHLIREFQSNQIFKAKIT